MSSDSEKASERARLEGYIAASLRLRRRLTTALVPVVVLALVITFLARTPGLIALVIAVSTIGIGVYITTAHVADWRAKIAKQSAPERVTTAGPRNR